MKILEYQLKFNTPAFLGNAEQAGQWRTPPIKALLRQWWRVAYAADRGFNVEPAAMRYAEGLLFGHAWLNDDHDTQGRPVTARKSQVQIRLDNLGLGGTDAWAPGSQTGVAPLPKDPSTSYAWFGLVNRGGGQLDRSAIKPDDREGRRLLRIAYPEAHDALIDKTIRLIHAFGQMGSRSRGGWGSLLIDNVRELDPQELEFLSRPIDQCLEHDWAMSLARDRRGLCVWHSKDGFQSWDIAMRKLAGERRTVRVSLKGNPDLRPALGFAGSGRMPSPLRWKIVLDETGKLRIRVFAMPHTLPEQSGKSMLSGELRLAWEKACSALDGSTLLARFGGRVQR